MNPLVQLARLEATNKTLWEEVKAVRAENDRLRADLDRLDAGLTYAEGHQVRAEAAIDRVRALRPFYISGDPEGYVSMRRLLAALDAE